MLGGGAELVFVGGIGGNRESFRQSLEHPLDAFLAAGDRRNVPAGYREVLGDRPADVARTEPRAVSGFGVTLPAFAG